MNSSGMDRAHRSTVGTPARRGLRERNRGFDTAARCAARRPRLQSGVASNPTPATPRRALLAGGTGLVGHELLALLLQSPHYRRVHALVRRPVPGWPADGKLQVHQVDFDRLAELPEVDDVFIALGTTIRQAGSQQAFRRVDVDAVLNVARAARSGGARRVLVVSALGADAQSRVFYNRVKGEMQAAVADIGYELVVFAQPSLLLGDRAPLGQPARRGEDWTMRLLQPIMSWVPRSVRPIAAHDVAAALLRAAIDAPAGVHVLRSSAMQPDGRRPDS